MIALPRDVPCPHCGAKIDHGCHSKKRPGYSAKTHMARWSAIGVGDVTPELLAANYADGQNRDYEIRRRVFAELRNVAVQ